MSQLQLEVQVSPSAEHGAGGIEAAARAFSAGDQRSAERGYREAQALPLQRTESLANLAALGVMLGDARGALECAVRALRQSQAHAGAWINFGVASWRLGRHRDAAVAMHKAVELRPGQDIPALNYARMLRSVGRMAQARDKLEQAASHNPGSWRLQEDLAITCRLLGPTEAAAVRRHALAALSLLTPTLPAAPNASTTLPPPGNPADDDAASGKVRRVLFAVGDALDAAGVPFHLIGGTLLAIHRDGRLFPHDKDIDLALPFETDRDRVAAAMSQAQGFRPLANPELEVVVAARQWVMGFRHIETDICVDLMFVRTHDGVARFALGAPDHLSCEMPAYPLQDLQWAGRAWRVPSPPERYLDAIYGQDWAGPAAIRGFDRRWFDTQVSNPSRTAESLPRAINLVLLRLLQALQAGQWARARALCIQIRAREPLAEVDALLARLGDAEAA